MVSIRIVPSEAGGKAVDARQLTAVVGEAAQQHRTALRKVYDGGDLFAAPLGFVRGNEERQPRLYRNGNFGGDQRRKSRPESGTSLQIAVKDDPSARHPRLVRDLAFEENRISRRIFPSPADDRIAVNAL